MQANTSLVGGNFCRDGINCRSVRTTRGVENPYFVGFFVMARGLLNNWRELLAAPRGNCWSFAMLLALGAAASALDVLKSLTSSKSTSPKSTGLSQEPANPFDLSGSATASASTSTSGSDGRPKISPGTMSALLAAQSQSSTGATNSASNSRTDALKDLFSQLDADGDGKISKSEFEDALGAGGTNIAKADDVFGKLDKDGDGTVSLDEMSSALNGAGKGRSHRHHMASGSGDPTSADPLQQALQGASSTSVTNSDGSITTSLTYADGSKVTMTSAAGASSAATSSYNFIEQMIAREAKAISSASTASLSVSA
jgi:Ca2+-binding EF-hand superfamily protein